MRRFILTYTPKHATVYNDAEARLKKIDKSCTFAQKGELQDFLKSGECFTLQREHPLNFKIHAPYSGILSLNIKI